MIEQLKTIREALRHGIKAINHLGGAREAMPLHDAMPALDQMEAQVREQKPVAFVNGAALSRLQNGESVPAYNCWGSPWPTPLYAAPVAQQYEAGDMASASAQGFRDGVASVAQQPQAEKPLAALEPASSYVQPVPDHCDRIVWRNNYYHLPLKQPQAEAVPSDVLGSEWAPCIKRPVVVHVRNQRPGEKHVSTREGITPVKPDDLIMRGVSGEEYPIGRAIFEQTYDFVDAAIAQQKGVNHG